VVHEAIQAFGRIDILINVAGGSGPMGKTGWETTREEFDEIVTLNMTGCFNTMRAVLPAMIARREGRIVNVGGTFGVRGRAGRMAYSASKFGLRGITKSMALEAGPLLIALGSDVVTIPLTWMSLLVLVAVYLIPPGRTNSD
jgi:NAD(P)-dependent dehydrogenase (short-subunit alcohol dehydrogenase family)